MAILALRLRKAGIKPSLFGYSPTFENWHGCSERLRRFIEARTAGGEPYVLIGHSLGTVLARALLPRLRHPPAGCFFIAPPSHACDAARIFSSFRLFKWSTGEMGQLLANAEFMQAIPIPSVPLKIYAGIGGPRGRWSPFKHEPNDGVLRLSEVQLGSVPVQQVRAMHTFLMNSKVVVKDIIQTIWTFSS